MKTAQRRLWRASVPAASRSKKGREKGKKVRLTRAVSAATKGASREAKKGKGKRSYGALALRSLESSHDFCLDSSSHPAPCWVSPAADDSASTIGRGS